MCNCVNTIAEGEELVLKKKKCYNLICDRSLNFLPKFSYAQLSKQSENIYIFDGNGLIHCVIRGSACKCVHDEAL